MKREEIFLRIKPLCGSAGQARRLSYQLASKSDKEIKDFIEKMKK